MTTSPAPAPAPSPSGAGAAKPSPRRLDVFETVYQSALLTLRRGARGRRILWAVAIVALPALLSFLVNLRGTAEGHTAFFFGMLSYYHFGLAVPVVALTFATAFPWPEAEEGTLTYWFTSPVWRWAIHLGRYAASLVLGMLVLPLSVLAIGLPLTTAANADIPVVMRSAIAATLLAYPAYLALFWLVSTAFRRGLAFGVVFVFIENSLSLITGAIARLTLIFYVRSHIWPSIAPGWKSRAAEVLRLTDPVGTGLSIAVFAGVTFVSLLLSLVLVQVIEYRAKTAQQG